MKSEDRGIAEAPAKDAAYWIVPAACAVAIAVGIAAALVAFVLSTR